MLSVFCAPARYVQGRDATLQLVSEMERLGLDGNVLLIASPSARKLLEPTWRRIFADEGRSFEILDFGGECSVAEIERGKDLARRMDAACVIGSGGGKVLDVARAVASELELPVVCCPSAASSDAPCSALSVVYTPEGQFEKVLFYRRNPDLVLVDTSVIVRSPVRLLVSGMGDALATWFEADTSIRAHRRNVAGGACTLAAASIAELCYRTLLRDGRAAVAAARAGAITPAFERIVEANTLLSGLGFESGGLCVAHSVHNGLTVMPQTHDRLHGEKVAFGTLVQLVLEGRNSGEVEEVLAFCTGVGLPVTLAEINLPDLSREQALLVAERALADGETAHNEPFELTAPMLADAILAADALGRDFRSRQAG